MAKEETTCPQCGHTYAEARLGNAGRRHCPQCGAGERAKVAQATQQAQTDIDRKLYGQGLVGPLKRHTGGPLHERFRFPPFSTLNTREGEWIARRKHWFKLGIQSELGRDEALTYSIAEKYGNMAKRAQTSVFDPVLCELIYHWWAPRGGVVLDPFAGGSVRGIVASVLGHKYWGCELRPEQVQANRDQLTENTCGKYQPKWVAGDSFDKLPRKPVAEFVISCPPYGNLETYSNNPADISGYLYEGFLERYTEIIARTAGAMLEDTFACFVVGNYRDPNIGGCMRDLAGDTCKAWAAAGCHLYNDVVLINSVGTGAMRANTNFIRGHRKVVKLHQNVLLFCKGDPTKAAARIPQEIE